MRTGTGRHGNARTERVKVKVSVLYGDSCALGPIRWVAAYDHLSAIKCGF